MTGTDDSADRPARERASPRRGQIVVALIALLFLFLLWQAFTYSGLIEKLAEWQFSWLRYWFPSFTLLLFCAAATLIWLVVGGLWAWRRKRKMRDNGTWVEADEIARKKRRMGIATSGLLMVATLCALLVLGGLVHWLRIPPLDNGPARAWNASGVLREGRTSLAGAAPIGPIARYREAIFDIGPDVYFVPIARRGGINGELTVFVELTMVNGKPRLVNSREGVLRRNALPGEIAILYGANGYSVTEKPAVIFRNTASASRATLVFMIEMLAAGLICLVFGLFLRRRYRKLQDYRPADDLPENLKAVD